MEVRVHHNPSNTPLSSPSPTSCLDLTEGVGGSASSHLTGVVSATTAMGAKGVLGVAGPVRRQGVVRDGGPRTGVRRGAPEGVGGGVGVGTGKGRLRGGHGDVPLPPLFFTFQSSVGTSPRCL